MIATVTTDSRWRRPILAAVLLFAVVIGARGWRDSAGLTLSADMARYLMNGVFVHDLVADGGAASLDSLTRYAELYYARYPALSLGHHPPLPYVALVPFYAVFGISIFAVKAAETCWFLLATWGLYVVARRLFGWQAASWAAALFVSNPAVLRSGQRLLSEMPMAAMVLLAVGLLLSYCETRRTWQLIGFVLAAAASLYAKQLAAFMLPVYLVILGTRLGWRTLFSWRALWVWSLAGVLALPIVLMTISLAPKNVGMVLRQATNLVTFGRQRSVMEILVEIITTHLSMPVLLAALAGFCLLAIRGERMASALIVWGLGCVGGTVIFAGGIEPARYAFGALPAYFLGAGSLVATVRAAMGRAAAVALLASGIGWQLWLARDIRPSGAGGYEAAAGYVAQHAVQPTVLFDTAVDTGYFVFFLRAHDPERRLIALRADKLLARGDHPALSDPAAVTSPTAIYDALGRFGVQFVVVEEGPKRPPVLQQLHDELRTDRFIERSRIPIVSTEPKAAGLSFVVYEFKDARPADPDATLNINLPLGRRQIMVRMRDLMGLRAR